MEEKQSCVNLEYSTTNDSLNSSGHSTSEATASSVKPTVSQHNVTQALPKVQHCPNTLSSADRQTSGKINKRSILGKRRHQQTFHEEFLAYLKESDTAHLAFHETRHKHLMESLQAEREAEAALKAEGVRVQETFNKQFINLFGQFVQVLRESRSHTPAQIPLD